MSHPANTIKCLCAKALYKICLYKVQPSLYVSGAVKFHAIGTEVPACPYMKKQGEIVWQYLFGIDNDTDISAVQKQQV